MATAKDLGIWMDHTSAHLMEFTTDPMVTKTIESKFTHQEKEQSLGKSENNQYGKASGFDKKFAPMALLDNVLQAFNKSRSIVFLSASTGTAR